MSSKKKSQHFFIEQNDQLPNQWEVHNNRLNFLEEVVTKIQKKIQKIDKALHSYSEAFSQMKNEFKSKLSEMISIVSEPSPVNIEVLEEIKLQIQGLKINQSEYILQANEMQAQIRKLNEKEQSDFNIGQFEQYIKNQIFMVEQKNKKVIDQKMKNVNSCISQLQKTTQLLKNQSMDIGNRVPIQQNTSVLNSSAYSGRNSSQSRLSNSKSQNRLQNSSRSNVYDIVQPIKQSASVKNMDYGVSSNHSRYNSSNLSNNQTHNNASSQNNSRVVYLREKLKEFQEINKKYENRELQSNMKKTEQNHNSNLVISQDYQLQETFSNRKSQQSNSHYRQQHRSPQDQRYTFKKRDIQTQSKPVSLPKHKGSNFSTNNKKSQMLNEIKQMNKLKDIKDYLEQSESQLDQSNILEPNYKV